MIDRAEKFAKFLRLGWTASSESGNRIFDFLYNASLEAGRDDLILDLGAGQCRYSFFFDHASYIGIDFGSLFREYLVLKVNFVFPIAPFFVLISNTPLAEREP